MFYRPLTQADIRGVAELLFVDLRRRLEGMHLKLEVTEAACDYIIASGFDPVYGARPLKRFIQSKVETLVARRIVAGDPEPGSTLTVDYDGHELYVR